MILCDTHSHLYLKEFKDDLDNVISNALGKDVKYIFLPNIDSSSIDDLLMVCNDYPDVCFPMMGLHPTSVKANYEVEIKKVEDTLKKHSFCAVGEIGIDLYWDKTYAAQQKTVFIKQVNTAAELNLPVVIHSRNSINDIIDILVEMNIEGLNGVFHCFSGNQKQADKIIALGFKLGIGGVVTFKNSGLQEVVEKTDLEHILLETDAPFLAPVPFRGKRNESAYIRIIAEKIAEIKNVTLKEVAEITSKNALGLFNIPSMEHVK